MEIHCYNLTVEQKDPPALQRRDKEELLFFLSHEKQFIIDKNLIYLQLNYYTFIDER